jgi:hypothetical protein
VTDPLLRRLERTAIAACLLMAAAAVPLGGWWAAAAVLGGGLIAAVSYASLASGVTALTGAVARAASRAEGPEGEGRAPSTDGNARAHAPGAAARTLAKVVLRYALLALLAYVMIARLRLHPIGLLAGVSSVVIAVAVEAVRIVVKKS